MNGPRGWHAGQGSVELLASVPVLVVSALLILQMAAVISGVLQAEQRVRERALAAPPGAAAGRIIREEVAIPRLVPGVGGLRAEATAGAAGPAR